MTILGRLIRRSPATSPYYRLPGWLAFAGRVLGRTGRLGRAMLDRTVRQLASDMPYPWVPAVLKESVLDERSRLLRGERAQPNSRARLDDDSFVKDLALARGVLWPAGVDLVERSAYAGAARYYAQGEPFDERSAQLQSEFSDAQQPFLEHHLWVRHEKRSFSHASRRDFYVWAGLIVRDDLDLWGLAMRVWYLDPALPRRDGRPGFWELPVRQGAALLLGPSDERAVALALRGSPDRQAVYDAGSYVPRWCTVLWPARPLQVWAEAQLAADGIARPALPATR